MRKTGRICESGKLLSFSAAAFSLNLASWYVRFCSEIGPLDALQNLQIPRHYSDGIPTFPSDCTAIASPCRIGWPGRNLCGHQCPRINDPFNTVQLQPLQRFHTHIRGILLLCRTQQTRALGRPDRVVGAGGNALGDVNAAYSRHQVFAIKKFSSAALQLHLLKIAPKWDDSDPNPRGPVYVPYIRSCFRVLAFCRGSSPVDYYTSTQWRERLAWPARHWKQKSRSS